MNFRQRSDLLELLDEQNIPFADIRQNMVELEFINHNLGGHAITLAGVKKLAGNARQIHVCEIGCGGGDNLAAIVRWGNNKGINITCTGIDIKKECLAVAKQHTTLEGKASWIESDYRQVTFSAKPDILFSSLFCHHFTNEQLVEQLNWMQQNSRQGFFINDLHRHWLAYYSIKLLTALFSKSYLVKNDAPLSVARGFRKTEWKNLLQKAAIPTAKVQWKWAFRHLIHYKKEKAID